MMYKELLVVISYSEQGLGKWGTVDFFILDFFILNFLISQLRKKSGSLWL